jgi:hypothetical protein
MEAPQFRSQRGDTASSTQPAWEQVPQSIARIGCCASRNHFRYNSLTVPNRRDGFSFSGGSGTGRWSRSGCMRRYQVHRERRLDVCSRQNIQRSCSLALSQPNSGAADLCRKEKRGRACPIEGLFAISAAFALPRFAAFLDQKPKDCERADTVDPPGSKDCLRTKAHDRDHRQPAARNGFHCIGP